MKKATRARARRASPAVCIPCRWLHGPCSVHRAEAQAAQLAAANARLAALERQPAARR